MDIVDNMEKISIRLAGVKRYLDHPLKVKAVGYLRNHYVKGEYSDPYSINFGIILACEEKTVVRRNNGKIHSLTVPCFGISKPGDVKEVISNAPWDEIYIAYPATLAEKFHEYGITPGSQGEIKMNTKITELCKEIIELCRNIHLSGNADRVDMLSENLIFECILSKHTQVNDDPKELAVRKIASFVGINYLGDIDFPGLMKKHSISYRTFLRTWKKLFGHTPQQYIMQMKIDDSCRELREGNLRISEIAAKLNFADALYFSRLFTRKTGLSPRAYRREHRAVRQEVLTNPEEEKQLKKRK